MFMTLILDSQDALPKRSFEQLPNETTFSCAQTARYHIIKISIFSSRSQFSTKNRQTFIRSQPILCIMHFIFGIKVLAGKHWLLDQTFSFKLYPPLPCVTQGENACPSTTGSLHQVSYKFQRKAHHSQPHLVAWLIYEALRIQLKSNKRRI